MDSPLELTIKIVETLAILILGIGSIFLAWMFRRLWIAIRGIRDDARPVFDRARAVGENLNFIVMSVRKEVDRVSETMAHANDRLEDALEAAEERVEELTALIDAVQGEVEDTLITASSALRGIRTGAKLLGSRKRRNDDEASAVEDEDE